MLKKINTVYRKIVPKKYKTLNQAITATPENTKKEIKIAKVGKKYIVINSNGKERSVTYTEDTLRNVFPKKRSKLIHTHVSGIKELPSGSDIANLISHYIKYNKDFDAISVMDTGNGKESGRIGILLTKEAKEYIKKEFDYDTLDDLDGMLDAFRDHISQRIDRVGYRDAVRYLLSKGISKSSPQYEGTLKDVQKKIVLRYFRNSLKLRLKFVPMPGYKFNKETVSFEKIK